MAVLRYTKDSFSVAIDIKTGSVEVILQGFQPVTNENIVEQYFKALEDAQEVRKKIREATKAQKVSIAVVNTQ